MKIGEITRAFGANERNHLLKWDGDIYTLNSHIYKDQPIVAIPIGEIMNENNWNEGNGTVCNETADTFSGGGAELFLPETRRK